MTNPVKSPDETRHVHIPLTATAHDYLYMLAIHHSVLSREELEDAEDQLIEKHLATVALDDEYPTFRRLTITELGYAQIKQLKEIGFTGAPLPPPGAPLRPGAAGRPTSAEREARYNLIKSVLQPGDLILEQRCGGTVMEFICTGDAPGGWRGLPTQTTVKYDTISSDEELPYERDDISPMNILYINRTAPESLTYEWNNDAWKARHSQLREENFKIVAANAALWDRIDLGDDDANAPDPSPEHIETVARRPSIIRRAVSWLTKIIENEAWASGYHEGRLDHACEMYASAPGDDEIPF